MLKKLFHITLALFIITACYFSLKLSYGILLNYVIYPKELINVSGTGSMVPTFPRGVGLTQEEREKEVVATVKMYKYPTGFIFNNKSYFRTNLGRGDLVSFFSNDKGLIKRIIGLPGDTIEIRSGLVYINGVAQKEPYTNGPHSTFGGDKIAECSVVKVPRGEYFVLGDNRKESSDSRFEIGFISESSIDGFLPFKDQIGYLDSLWRDTTSDLDNSTKISLNKADFMASLNKLRSEKNIKELKYNNKLESSAFIRANSIYKSGSFDANKKGNSDVGASIQQAGYWQPVYGEIPVQGYYTSEELFGNIIQFPSSIDFVTDPDFEELGIATVEGQFNGCPTQLIVIHFAGYVPPNYSKETVTSWDELLKALKDIKPGWESLKKYDTFYSQNKRDVDKIISIINDRIDYLSPLVKKMKNNEWLTQAELSVLDEDSKLNAEQELLSKKLNSL